MCFQEEWASRTEVQAYVKWKMGERIIRGREKKYSSNLHANRLGGPVTALEEQQQSRI